MRNGVLFDGCKKTKRNVFMSSLGDMKTNDAGKMSFLRFTNRQLVSKGWYSQERHAGRICPNCCRMD